jgi:hypothetical protein
MAVEKYNVRMWYTVSRMKDIVIKANSLDEAEKIAWETAQEEDTSDWEECDDANFEIDVSKSGTK